MYKAIFITPATDSTCAWHKETKRFVNVGLATGFNSREHAINYWQKNKDDFPEHVIAQELEF